MKILVVAGARPNFMKVAPLLAELHKFPAEFELLFVHTGQHFDFQMSEVFFEDLDLPDPQYYLHAGSGNPAHQTAQIVDKLDPILESEHPDLVVVVGDVTSTPACAVAASKRDVAVAHVEAGLRSGDRRMPEELNRLATDALSDLLFTYSADADDNLLAENVPASCIFRVGNLMIDTLVRLRPRAAASDILERLELSPREYVLATLHRPSNVDDPNALRGILGAFDQIQGHLPILFQIHHRARQRLAEFGMESYLEGIPNLRLLPPQGYLDFLRLQEGARLVLTDSGGLQEEATILGVPCLTLRRNTERPITIEKGTNRLVGQDPEQIVSAALETLENDPTTFEVPELWDGHSAERLVAVLRRGIERR